MDEGENLELSGVFWKVLSVPYPVHCRKEGGKQKQWDLLCASLAASLCMLMLHQKTLQDTAENVFPIAQVSAWEPKEGDIGPGLPEPTQGAGE